MAHNRKKFKLIYTSNTKLNVNTQEVFDKVVITALLRELFHSGKLTEQEILQFENKLWDLWKI